MIDIIGLAGFIGFIEKGLVPGVSYVKTRDKDGYQPTYETIRIAGCNFGASQWSKHTFSDALCAHIRRGLVKDGFDIWLRYIDGKPHFAMSKKDGSYHHMDGVNELQLHMSAWVWKLEMFDVS